MSQLPKNLYALASYRTLEVQQKQSSLFTTMPGKIDYIRRKNQPDRETSSGSTDNTRTDDKINSKEDRDPDSESDSSSPGTPTISITDDPNTGMVPSYVSPKRLVIEELPEAKLLDETYSNLSSKDQMIYHAVQSESQRRLQLLDIVQDSLHEQKETLQTIMQRFGPDDNFGDFISNQFDEPEIGEELQNIRNSQN